MQLTQSLVGSRRSFQSAASLRRLAVRPVAAVQLSGYWTKFSVLIWSSPCGATRRIFLCKYSSALMSSWLGAWGEDPQSSTFTFAKFICLGCRAQPRVFGFSFFFSLSRKRFCFLAGRELHWSLRVCAFVVFTPRGVASCVVSVSHSASRLLIFARSRHVWDCWNIAASRHIGAE